MNQIPLSVICAQLGAVYEGDRDVQFGRFLHGVKAEVLADPVGLITKEAFLEYVDTYGDISDNAYSLICEAADDAFEQVRRADAIGVGDVVEVLNEAGQVVVDASEVTSVQVQASDSGEVHMIKTAAGGSQKFSSSEYTLRNLVRTAAEVAGDSIYVGQNVEIRDMVGTEVIIPASLVTDQQITRGANGVVIRIRTEKSQKIHGLGYISNDKNTFNVV